MTDKDSATGRRPPPPTRPALSPGYIVAVALSLIDQVGLDRFSMRKLGAEQGVDPMAVYHYFEDQEALFDGIAEALFDELDVDSLPWHAPWRVLAEQFFRRMRDTLLAHPRAVTIFASRPVRSSTAISVGNRTIAVLRDAGFAPELALQITRCLREFTIGHAMTLAVAELGGNRSSKKPAPNSPGYNLLARSADAAGLHEHFDIGLTAMLDGFQRLTR